MNDHELDGVFTSVVGLYGATEKDAETLLDIVKLIGLLRRKQESLQEERRRWDTAAAAVPAELELGLHEAGINLRMLETSVGALRGQYFGWMAWKQEGRWIETAVRDGERREFMEM